MYAMFAVLPLMTSLIDDKRRRTLQRMVMLPVSRTKILGGKLLARFALGMVQYMIVFGVGFLLGVRYGSDPFALLLIMMSFVLCITALALAFSTLLTTSAQASGISLFLTLTLAPLGGAWWPLDIVPGWMQTIGRISPVSWAMDGYQQLIFFGGSLFDVLPMIGVLLAMGAAFFAFGVLRFRFD
jgi:ABC-2 type transport system permease protein